MDVALLYSGRYKWAAEVDDVKFEFNDIEPLYVYEKRF